MMLLREVIPPAFAVAVPSALDALTALDVPVVATATLLAVVVLGVRIGNVEKRLDEHGRILESHGRILESVKSAMQRL